MKLVKTKGAHGDVIVRKVKAFPKGERVQDAQCQEKILAYGEMTGHAHRIHSETGVEVFRILNKLYVNALQEFELKHEEHRPIRFSPGKYEVEIVRETDWLTRTVRRVAD